MATKWKVSEREYNQWVKFLKNQGYSGPFSELTIKHECVKLLAKELKKRIIPGTRPRDPRTIASNLTRYERGRGQPRLSKGESETNVDAIALIPGLERRHKTWILHEWLGLDEGEIAGILDIPPKDVQQDIEETGKELRSKTKEESKMAQNQSMLNLPPWVNQAQREHLEGREQRDELGEGISVATYPGGIGIRQQLELLKSCFPEVDPRDRSFYRPLDEITAAQLRGHLPDEAFWSRAEDFWEKAKECDALVDAAYAKLTSVGEKLVRLSASGLARITSGWERQVVYQALGPPLGFKNLPRYLVDISKEGGSTLTCYELLYSGPDAADAEKAKQIHQQLAEDFKQTEEFSLLIGLMKDRQNLRPQILTRIDQCLRGKEYSYNYCPDCPADQARKMLKRE